QEDGPGIRPRNDCTPSFTQQDVRDYLAHVRGVVFNSSIRVDGQPTVTRVVFLTIGDLSRASGDYRWEQLNPEDALVCYAQLGGPLTSVDPSGPPTSLSTAFILFDAHTGNTLVASTGARLG